MTDFELREINPTFDNARNIVWMVAQDLHEAYVPNYEIKRIADPCDNDMVERQRLRVAQHPERYLGAFEDSADKRLIGFSMVNEWLPGDEKLFTSRLRRLGSHILHHQEPMVRPVGIHSLIADHKEKKLVQKQVVGALLDDATETADGGLREIRTSTYTFIDDYFQALLIAKGFKRTRRIGYPVAGARQELYVRPKQIAGVDRL
jgi:hypothetical protein